VLSGRTQKSARLHKRVFGWGRIGQNPAENASESHEDKPFAAASRLTAKAARDYTKWPEVKALPGVDVDPAGAISAAVTEGSDGPPGRKKWGARGVHDRGRCPKLAS
jgi:hypothetical protein